MTTPSNNLHFYEVIGEGIFRIGGTRFPVRCMIIRTRVLFAVPHGDGFQVAIADIASGYQNCFLPYWFDDWTEKDHLQNDDMQSGRPVDIALTVEGFESVMNGGLPCDISAVRVNDYWVYAQSFRVTTLTSS